MPVLPTDPLPYADFILQRLMQPMSPDGRLGRAVAETEYPILGDRWFWADDNAKILEFLSLPAVWRRHPGEVAQIFRFLASLCEGPFIFRRTGHARLERSRQDDRRPGFIHTFLQADADLPAGLVTIGMRFHDGRDARNVIFGGNYVHFVHDGEFHSLDVEDAITGWNTEFTGAQARMVHHSELDFPHQGRRLRLGRLTYSYRLHADSMFIDVEAALELDPGITVSDVVLTIGHDNLSHGGNNVHYGSILADVPGRDPLRLDAAAPMHHSLPAAGATYWSMVQQDEMRGFALAVHSMPRDPGRLASIEATVQAPNRLHWVVAQHRFAGAWRGDRLVAAERKTITSGGFYDRVADCSALFRGRATAPNPLGQPLDFSISYDYGAEMAAFARCHRGAGLPGMPAAAVALRAESRALFDHYHAVYADNLLAAHRTDSSTLFSRPLAFLALGLVDMWKATGEERYRSALRETAAVLLEFERPLPGLGGEPTSGFVMGARTPWPYLDCHGAALLALVRAMPVLDDAGIAASVERGLNAYRLGTTTVDLGGPRKFDGVVIGFPTPEGGNSVWASFWNFQAALSLRAFRALRAATYPALRAVMARQGDRLLTLEAVFEFQIGRSLREHAGALEIRTSTLSGEGNSETQPWVALAAVADAGDD